MTPILEKIRKDFDNQPNKEKLDWKSFVAGYLDAVKRFGGKK